MTKSQKTGPPADSAGPLVFRAISLTMHPDRKIGIAMGILLIGVVAALFFRNEPLDVDDGLSSRRKQELNQRLRDRDVAVYLESDPQTASEVSDPEPEWTLSELFDKAKQSNSAPVPIGLQPPSADAPVGTLPVIRERSAMPIRAPGQRPPESASDAVAADTPAETSSLKQLLSANAEDAQEPAGIGDMEFEEYTVRFGDTLSEISERFLGSQTRYREIYEMNRDRMSSPDHLKVGKAIRVPRVLR